MPTRLGETAVIDLWLTLEDAQDARLYSAGLVYFIQAGDDGPIKIGWTASSNVEKRLRGLQTGNPHRLYLRATVSGTLYSEQMLQRLLGNSRLEGEWFKADAPGLTEFIEWARQND